MNFFCLRHTIPPFDTAVLEKIRPYTAEPREKCSEDATFLNSDRIQHLPVVGLTTNQHVPDNAMTMNEESLRIQVKMRELRLLDGDFE
jgi:hypothetical protein